MRMSLKVITVSAAVLGVVALVGLGTILGVGLGGQSDRVTVAERESNPAPCNLRLVWDRVSESFTAVYGDSAFIGMTPEYGRTANLSCSDAEIIDWQTQRRADGLDEQVCRPVVFEDKVAAVVRTVGCAVPVMVVDDESL